MRGRHKTSRAVRRPTTRLLDPEDGSGDRILEIPDAVMIGYEMEPGRHPRGDPKGRRNSPAESTQISLAKEAPSMILFLGYDSVLHRGEVLY